jgi:hypothetical protein
MRLFRIPFGLAVWSLATVSCGEPTSRVPRSAPFFRTDSEAYTVKATSTTYTVNIGVEFTNGTGSPAYFVNCNGATSLTLEKRVGVSWEAVWSPIMNLCLSRPITVLPGETRDMSLGLFAFHDVSNKGPLVTADLNGTFRLIWHSVVHDYQDRLPFGEPLPVEARVSNSFSLTVVPAG